MLMLQLVAAALVSGGLTSGCALIQRAIPSTMSDKNVISLLDTINANEIEGAQLARRQASSQVVRDYAERLASEHAALLTQKHVFADRHHMQPKKSSLASSIEAANRDRLKALAKKSGPDFDRAYIDDQIAMHHRTLDIVEDTAIDDAQLKDDLRDARLDLIAHAAKARSIREQLRAASARPSSER
jgi:putative membrane protein